VYPVCLIVLILIYWNTAVERVPLYLSNSTTWQTIGDLTAQQNGAFLDLGCGLGGILFYLSKRYPEKHFVGIESAPLPFIIAKIRQLISPQTNIEILYGDFWHQDFSTYGFIYAFLSPAPMDRLLEKVSNEMHKGGLFISNSFFTPKIQPSQIFTLEDSRQTKLYFWYF
jgi:SAM-dependent methyltransferase